MKISRWSAKKAGASIIALLASAACNQPTLQANTSTNPTLINAIARANISPTTGTASPSLAQSLSADDAAEKVENALENNSTLKAFDLDADDEGKTIVIKGRVQNQSQKALAETVAKQTAPGFSLVNRITIAPANTASTTGTASSSVAQSIGIDDAAEKVEKALENNSTLKAFDLDAEDEGKTIVLKGRVQNQSQKTLAETVAKQTAPGFSLVNRITF